MSYSDKNPAWHLLMQYQHAQRIQEEARIAQSVRWLNPGMSRDEALREAARIYVIWESHQHHGP